MTTYALGPFRLDTLGGVLLRGGEPVALGQRAVALLRALVGRPGALVSKDALIEAAWPGLAVEDSNLAVQIGALRRALGQTPGGERWIETMPRRGYRFIGPLVANEDSVMAPSSPVVASAEEPAAEALSAAVARREAAASRTQWRAERRRSPPSIANWSDRRRKSAALISKTGARQSGTFSAAFWRRPLVTKGSSPDISGTTRSPCLVIPPHTKTTPSGRSARASNCARQSKTQDPMRTRRCGAVSASRQAWPSSPAPSGLARFRTVRLSATRYETGWRGCWHRRNRTPWRSIRRPGG